MAVPNAPSLYPGEVVPGVLAVRADGTQPQVLLQVEGVHQPPYVVWDLCTGQPITPAGSALPPALRYTWTSQGTLAPA